MGKYEGLSNQDKQNIVSQGGTPISSKIIFASENVNSDTRLVDAVNIDWQGYKLGNDAIDNTHNVVSYMNNAYSYLVNSYSFVLQELEKKANVSQISDITGDSYVDTLITIYTAVNDRNNVPSLWNDDTLRDALPTGWYENTYPEGRYVFMSSCYRRTWLDGRSPKYHGPCGKAIFLPSENGLNGNFKSTVFVRTNSVPDTPANGAYYDTGLPSDTVVYSANTSLNKTWSDGIPSGSEILWATNAVISDDNGNYDSSSVWSTPRQMTDTSVYDVEFSPYSNGSNTAPNAVPTTGNRHDALPDHPKNQRWFDPTQDATINSNVSKVNDKGQIGTNSNFHTPQWTDMIWRAERECINGEWSNWTISRIRGENGNNGVSGPFRSTVFTRSEDDLSGFNVPENDPDGVYNKYDNAIPQPSEYHGVTVTWSDGIPAGPGAVWATSRTFYVDSDTGEWTMPQMMADTPTYDVEFAFEQQNNATPTRPIKTSDINTVLNGTTINQSDVNTNGASTGNQIWYDPTLDTLTEEQWTEMVWRAERTRATRVDEWGEWVITKIKGEDGNIPKPMDYYQMRYAMVNVTTLNNDDKIFTTDGGTPTSQYISSQSGVEWYLTIPSDGTGNVWQTSRRVTWEESNNTWTAIYDDEEWSDPFMLNGIPGEAQPIHPCLRYKWEAGPQSVANGYTPTVNINITNNQFDDWNESPGNPTQQNISDGKTFLWMIQLEYKLGSNNAREYQPLDTVGGQNVYWTNPVCLTGADGKTGEDGDDIEFIYHSFPDATSFDGTTDDSPQHWYTTNIVVDYEGTGTDPKAKRDYLGPTGKTWSDNASDQVVTSSNKYVYCSYRRSVKSGDTRQWTPFSPPFPWSIWGENGIDGDGVEYIYLVSDKYPFNQIQNAPYPSSWTNNERFQEDDFPCVGTNGANILGNGWTDEPTGVSLNNKYEYVATRKKQFKPGSDREKEWGPFGTPKLWSNFAEDGLATNMVLETDNDNVTVGIDTDGLVNGDYTASANICLKYNGADVDTNKYTLSIYVDDADVPQGSGLICNDNIVSLNGHAIVTLTGNRLSVDMPKNFPMGTFKNILPIELSATMTDTIPGNNDITVGNTYIRMFKITGVKLSISDIYQLNISTTTPHRNAQNDGFEPVSIRLKSYTSENSISSATQAKSQGLFIVVESTQKTDGTNTSSTQYIIDFTPDDGPYELSPYYNKNKFTLYYNANVNDTTSFDANSIPSNSVWLDEEELSAVYDGNNGVDSRSEEYMYLLTDDIDFISNHKSNKYYDPQYWMGHVSNYDDDDFPFTTSSPTVDGTKYTSNVGTYNADAQGSHIYQDKVINIWTDNPQGVSDEYPYEFRCYRRYDTSKPDGSRWQAFNDPSPWSNWGHNGEDGDGVEYIYYRRSTEWSDTYNSSLNPAQWIYISSGVKFTQFQQSEYLPQSANNGNNPWTDNPTGVEGENKYEYVSVRRYKLYNANQFVKDVNGIAYKMYYDKDGNVVSNTSTLYHINDTAETLTAVYEHLLSLTGTTPNFVNLFNDIKAFCEQNGLTSSNIYDAVHVIDGNGTQQAWNFWLYNIMYFVCEAKTYIQNEQKIWTPYSSPKLWSEIGPQGPTGGSGLTFDFDNPSMQIATNNTTFIKDNQTVTTYLKVYSGANKISASDVTLSIKSSGTHAAFKSTYTDANRFGYKLYNGSDCTYYTWRIADVDTSDDGTITSNEYTNYNNLKLADNSQIEFKIKLYNSNSQQYTKHVNLVPIHYGEDGQDAETFELHCQNSVTHYNKMVDVPSFDPASVEYQLKHVTGNSSPEFLTPGGTGATAFSVWYRAVSGSSVQNAQPTTQGHLYGPMDATVSATGIYTNLGTAINGSPSQQTSPLTTDPEEVSGEQQKVISVHEVSLVDDQSNTLDNAQQLILGALDEQYGWSQTLDDAGYAYDDNSIDSVITQLRNLANQIELQGRNSTGTAARLNEIADAIENVASTIGETDTTTGTYSIKEGYETILVADKKTEAQIVTREQALVIKQQDTTRSTKESEPLIDGAQQGDQHEGQPLRSAHLNAATITPSSSGYTQADSGVIPIQTVLSSVNNPTGIEVILCYKNGNVYELWDNDMLEVIYDGVDGTDGDGVEYIYYLSTGTEQPSFGTNWTDGDSDVNTSINPMWWTPNGEVTLDGHNYTGESDFIPPTQTSNWFDHPQGVTSSRTWEYVSMREYDGETKKWGRYSSPQPWSHYGHDGRDGDGVEYIYAVGTMNNQDVWRGAFNYNATSSCHVDPRTWMFDTNKNNSNVENNFNNYNTTEYIPSNASSIWKDDPAQTLSAGQYQFVAVRKYKELTQQFVNSLNVAETSATSLMNVFGIDNNANLLTTIRNILNQHVGEHIWFPYSEPKLWNYRPVDGQFKSIVFTRKLTAPTTPTGGTYSDPIPTNTSSNGNLIWSDGIPNDSDNPIWSSSRIFRPNETSDVTSGWSQPALVADTELYDVEFAFEQADDATPATPTTGNRHKDNSPYNGQIWFDPIDDKNSLPSGKTWSDMVWRAERERTPGTTTFSAWVITRIKGEKGDPGANAITLDWTNDQINLAVKSDTTINNTAKQSKSTTLYIYNSTSNVSNVTVSSSLSSSTSISVGSNGSSINTTLDTSKIRLYVDYYTNYITCAVETLRNACTASIPESGIDLSFNVTFADNTTRQTTLRICGQHNGENAVTYELTPSHNAFVKKSSGAWDPNGITVKLTKYNGSNITSLSYNDFKNNFLVSYYIGTHTTQRYYTGDPINPATCLGGGAIDGNVTTYLRNGTSASSTVIDKETIPFINDGERGAQGFTGPVVRQCGKYNAARYYGDGTYNTNYDGTSILYKDIVTYTNYFETKYYTPDPNNHTGFISNSTNNYLCRGNGYVKGVYPTTPGNENTEPVLNQGWLEAQQFDFIATKLLYADQALIQQISSHDFIATDSAGYPVAGMTSGLKNYGNNTGTQSLLSGATTVSNITTSGNSDAPTLGNDTSNDKSHVRIFAGPIKRGNKYSLTYAPFNVRQDGTTYMSKAVVEGDITAKSLKLNKEIDDEGKIVGSFVNITADSPVSIYLPILESNITRTIYILCNTSLNNNAKIVKVQGGNGSLVWGENPKSRTSNEPTRYIYVQPYMLYQLIGMNNDNNQTWTVIETPLSPEDGGSEYKYVDVTNDVQLFGYRVNTNTSKIIISTYDDGDDVSAWGPLLYDNGSSITVEFYTFLDPQIYGNDTNYAIADLSNFAWIYQTTT